jgi:hypothetical protein
MHFKQKNLQKLNILFKINYNYNTNSDPYDIGLKVRRKCFDY